MHLALHTKSSVGLLYFWVDIGDSKGADIVKRVNRLDFSGIVLSLLQKIPIRKIIKASKKQWRDSHQEGISIETNGDIRKEPEEKFVGHFDMFRLRYGRHRYFV